MISVALFDFLDSGAKSVVNAIRNFNQDGWLFEYQNEAQIVLNGPISMDENVAFHTATIDERAQVTTSMDPIVTSSILFAFVLVDIAHLVLADMNEAQLRQNSIAGFIQQLLKGGVHVAIILTHYDKYDAYIEAHGGLKSYLKKSVPAISGLVFGKDVAIVQCRRASRGEVQEWKGSEGTITVSCESPSNNSISVMLGWLTETKVRTRNHPFLSLENVIGAISLVACIILLVTGNLLPSLLVIFIGLSSYLYLHHMASS